MTEPSPPTQRRPKLGCLAQALIALAAIAVTIATVVITWFISSENEFAKVKPEAERLADEFAQCALATDRSCIDRLSTWDEPLFVENLHAISAANAQLGKRGAATLDEQMTRHKHDIGIGTERLRWRIQLTLSVAYEKDPKAREHFLLEDKGKGLQVVRMSWESEKLAER